MMKKDYQFSSSWREITYSYNESGFLIKTEENNDGKITETISYIYDEKGNVTYKSIVDDKGNKEEWTYDQYGNMLTYYNSYYSYKHTYYYELHFFPNSVPTHPETYENYIAE